MYGTSTARPTQEFQHVPIQHPALLIHRPVLWAIHETNSSQQQTNNSVNSQKPTSSRGKLDTVRGRNFPPTPASKRQTDEQK